VRYLAIPALVAAALAMAWLDTDSGLRAWLGLRRDVAAARDRIEGLSAEVAELDAQARALASDRFAQERAIREELDWALPGEQVVRLPAAAPDRDPDRPENPPISLTK
jgi:cell division protein FtsB